MTTMTTKEERMRELERFRSTDNDDMWELVKEAFSTGYDDGYRDGVLASNRNTATVIELMERAFDGGRK